MAKCAHCTRPASYYVLLKHNPLMGHWVCIRHAEVTKEDEDNGEED